MGLSPISTNSAGRNGDSPSTSITRAYADTGSEVAATPSSIQSMLKNTTETGEIGLFSIRPARLSTAVPPRTSSLPCIPDGLPQHPINQLAGRDRRRCAGDGRLNSLQSYRGTTTSSIISLYQSESQRSYRPGTSHNAGNEQRTFSMSQSSQSLSNHRSYTGLRPRSPFAYPTRLKRPGYRPSSPALTDFNGTDTRTHVGLDQGASFRTPSPHSMYVPERQPTGYHPAMNRSLPSLHYAPSIFSASQGRALRTPSVSSRTPTMRHPPYARSGSQLHGLYRGTSQGSAWSHSQPSPTPMYYDYSEVYEEQHRLNHTNISVLSLAEQVGSENRCPGDIPEPGATDVRLEDAQLDDANGPTYKSPNRSQPYVESPSPVSAPNKFLKQMSEWEKEQDSPQYSGKNSDERQETITTTGNLDRELKAMQRQSIEEPTFVDTVGHHILSSSRPQTRDRFIKGPHYTIDERSTSRRSTNEVILNEESLDARNPLDVVTNISQSLHSFTPRIQGHLPPAEWTIPSLNFGPLEIDTRACSILEGRSDKPIGPILSREAGYPAIQAPVPKRSTSFQKDRDHFSRILSIDEGFAQLARAVLDSGLQSGTTPHASVVSHSTSASISRQDPSGPPASDFSSAVSSKASQLAETQDRSSSTKDHQDKPKDKPLQRAASSRCESATKSAVEVFPHVDITAYPEHRLPAQPEKAPKPEKSTYVNFERSGPASDTGFAQLHREYGALPEQFVKSSTPRVHHSAVRHSRLPYSAPALAASMDETASMALLEAASIVPWEYDEPKKDETFPITKNRLRAQSEGASRGLPFDPRPADLSAEFQWAGVVEKRAPSPHDPLSKSKPTKAEAPKFKLKITRASSSTNGTVRVTLSPTAPPRHSFGTTFDLFQGGPSRRRTETESTADGNLLQVNLTAQTRPEVGGDGIPIETPQIGIRPPSPTLHFADVRSFFSDDSSNIEQKGSLRQRLSQLKVIASRGNSTEELRNSDRKQTGAAIGRPRGSRANSTRHNRHGSVQSGRTSGAVSNAKRKRWKIGGKLKSWWHRGEDKLKGLGKKMKKGRKKRSVSSDLYAGV